MKKLTKILLLTLVAAMLVGVLASCSGSKDPASTTAASGGTGGTGNTSTTEGGPIVPPGPELPPLIDLPNVKYNTEYQFFMTDDMFVLPDILAFEDATDPVGLAVWERNALIEDTYGIEIKVKRATDGSAYESSVNIQAGDSLYDTVACHGRYAVNFVLNGLLKEWTKLEHLNLAYEWWNQSCYESFKINDRVYFMTGSLAHTSLGSCYFLLGNKDRMDDADGVEVPYDDVRNGTWTFDKMTKIALDLAQDLNGDGKIVNGEDVMGYLDAQWGGPIATFYASGNRTLTIDSNGVAVNTVGTESAYNALVRYFDFTNNEKCFLADGNHPSESFNSVKAGNFIFYVNTIEYTVQRFSDVEFAYAILPYPKMTDDVKEYTSHTAGSLNMYLIPRDARDPVMSSVILEALAQEGHKNVIPTYIDNIVSVKTMKSEDNYDMLQFIRKGQLFDLGYFIQGYMGALPAGLAVKHSAEEFYSMIETQSGPSNDKLIALLAAYSD